MAAKPVAEMGPIREGECYPLSIFKRLAGLSNSEFQELQIEGLKIRRAGKMSYVLGADWIAHLKRQTLGCRASVRFSAWGALLARLVMLWFAAD